MDSEEKQIFILIPVNLYMNRIQPLRESEDLEWGENMCIVVIRWGRKVGTSI
jgi:hypothetical protein